MKGILGTQKQRVKAVFLRPLPGPQRDGIWVVPVRMGQEGSAEAGDLRKRLLQGYSPSGRDAPPPSGDSAAQPPGSAGYSGWGEKGEGSGPLGS